MSIEKADVAIQEKPKTPEQEALDKLTERVLKKVEPPPIQETLDKVKAAIAQAQKAKHKPVKMTWYCTDCGNPHIQNDGMGMGLGHIQVDVIDGDFVDSDGNPLTGQAATLMEQYATPKVKDGRGHMHGQNQTTLSQKEQLPSKKKL
jgi:hypothetical protein